MSKGKSVLFWILSIIIMAIVAIYQYTTGPTYPVRGKVELSSKVIKYSLNRSHAGEGGEIVKIAVPDTGITGKLSYKRFKSNDEWLTVPMIRSGDTISAELPHQSMAGKIIYSVTLESISGQKSQLTNEPVIIRFRGDVPAIVVIIHIFLMFISFTFSVRTGFEALLKGDNVKIMTLLTFILLLIGGMVSGPVMQKFAFDAYWTGWPFGHDLTDNKTVVGVLVWLIALWRIWKNPASKKWALIASIVIIAAYLIPHSILGSEIDYTQMPKH
jgi:hypothetical protein